MSRMNPRATDISPDCNSVIGAEMKPHSIMACSQVAKTGAMAHSKCNDNRAKHVCTTQELSPRVTREERGTGHVSGRRPRGPHARQDEFYELSSTRLDVVVVDTRAGRGGFRGWFR
jgi:hypothetical protein